MSIDYVKFMEWKRTSLKHLKEVYSGTTDEEELDHSNLVTTLIPVLLRSDISASMRAFLLRQYSEIRGTIRDQNLGLLERNDFYLQAVDDTVQEEDFAAQRETIGATQFNELVDYFDDDDIAEVIKKAAEEHEVFKNSMGDVIKSSVGLSADSVIGPEELMLFENMDLEIF